MASEEKAIKVIEFTGTDFKIWSKKFVARANRKGYNRVSWKERNQFLRRASIARRRVSQMKLKRKRVGLTS